MCQGLLELRVQLAHKEVKVLKVLQAALVHKALKVDLAVHKVLSENLDLKELMEV